MKDVHIENATLEELLDDLTGPTAGRPDRPVSPVANWLKEVGIYPGTTRVRAQDLYSEFLEWISAQSGITGKIPNISHWGREMNRHLKRGTIRAGTVYYISRRQDPTIPATLKNKQ